MPLLQVGGLTLGGNGASQEASAPEEQETTSSQLTALDIRVMSLNYAAQLELHDPAEVLRAARKYQKYLIDGQIGQDEPQ